MGTGFHKKERFWGGASGPLARGARNHKKPKTGGRCPAAKRNIMPLRRLRRVANNQIERSGSDLAKPCVAVEGNRNADRGVVAGKAESAGHVYVVYLVVLQRPPGFS